MTLSDRLKHFFHVVSNIRPIVWIGLYICLIPVFALVYWWLPDSQFRIPDGAGTDYGSWLYYSIVTITTLGFGDYTPAHGWAQAVTAVEVGCGLVFLGFFLNAVGSMKSEIDIASEKEKQRLLHVARENDKLMASIPILIHNLNNFLAYCYAVTTPLDKRSDEKSQYNPDFTFNDMRDLYKPSGLSVDNTRLPAVTRLLNAMSQTSLALDSVQSRIDLTIWPELLELCFAFVATSQMFSSEDAILEKPNTIFGRSDHLTIREAESQISEQIAASAPRPGDIINPDLKPFVELYSVIKDNAAVAVRIETKLSSLGVLNAKQ